MPSVYLTYSVTSAMEHFAFAEALYNRLRERNFDVVDPRRFTFPGQPQDVMSHVQEMLGKSDLVVAILGPIGFGVSFDLGYAMGIGKDVLVVHGLEFGLPRMLLSTNSIRTDLTDEASVSDVMNYIEQMQIPAPSHESPYLDFRAKLLTYRNDPHFFEQIDGMEFEKLIFEFLLSSNYGPTYIEKRIEQGYDFVLTSYKNYGRTIVEVKKYGKNSKVGIGQVQQLLGAVYAFKADCGILISTSKFTSSAMDFARKSERNIELWDIDRIVDQLIADDV